MNRIRMDPEEFQKSITEELDTIKNRVRNLIGSSHWEEEGRYKEAILRNVIKRFLPSNLSIGTGFVIRKEKNREPRISKQIDVIIYDNTIPVLFSEGDFVITTHKNVKGIIEVKTKIRNSKFEEIIKDSEESGKLIGKGIFNGIFSYEYKDNIDHIDQILKKAEGYVNHISLGPKVFIRFWKREDRSRLKVNNCDNDFYNIYKLEGLSFSYFISNLLELTCSSNFDDRWWFLYPIEGTKEVCRVRTICLETKSAKKYLEFYSKLVDEYKKINPRWRKVKPQPQNWLSFGAGKGGLSFVWAFKRNNRFAIELYIDTGDKNKNERIFEELEKHKDKIENEIKGLIWERMEEKRACRIAIYKNIKGNIKYLSEEDYPEIIEWASKTMKEFSNVLSRYIKKI